MKKVPYVIASEAKSFDFAQDGSKDGGLAEPQSKDRSLRALSCPRNDEKRVSQHSRFKFIDRGYEDSMLLIPGWATDSRIFEPLDIPFNYILPENISPQVFDEVFIKSADELSRRGGIPPPAGKTAGLHLFGWSMGGLIAAGLASKHASAFKSVTLAGMRRRYDPDTIENVRRNVRRNARAYLHKFYDALFSEGEAEKRRWFKARLLQEYLAEMREGVLLEGLDYISRTRLECNGLAGSNVMFVHGDADTIAPIEEIEMLLQDLPGAKLFCIAGGGHAPFLRKEFADRFSNG